MCTFIITPSELEVALLIFLCIGRDVPESQATHSQILQMTWKSVGLRSVGWGTWLGHSYPLLHIDLCLMVLIIQTDVVSQNSNNQKKSMFYRGVMLDK